MVQIPEEYVIQQFYQHTNKPKYNRLTKTYQGGCPICKEGTSWGQKRRLFYVLDKNLIYCHNCGWSSSPLKWLMQVTGKSYNTILKEVQQYDTDDLKQISSEDTESKHQSAIPDLPDDYIDLFDTKQVEFYKDNKIITKILEYIKDRRLDTAINKPKSLFTSLSDKVHKNRLIIPFYDNGKVIHYQSRGILDEDIQIRPKYLSKIKSDKSLFNIDNIKNTCDYIFIFEGPIDSCFITNGVAVAGIQENSKLLFSPLQQTQISRFPLYKLIWVLDNQRVDKASFKKSGILADRNQTIFIWPESISKEIKDFNDICRTAGIDMVNPEFVVNNSYSGLKAKLLLSQIKI